MWSSCAAQASAAAAYFMHKPAEQLLASAAWPCPPHDSEPAEPGRQLHVGRPLYCSALHCWMRPTVMRHLRMQQPVAAAVQAFACKQREPAPLLPPLQCSQGPGACGRNKLSVSGDSVAACRVQLMRQVLCVFARWPAPALSSRPALIFVWLQCVDFQTLISSLTNGSGPCSASTGGVSITSEREQTGIKFTCKEGAATGSICGGDSLRSCGAGSRADTVGRSCSAPPVWLVEHFTIV